MPNVFNRAAKSPFLATTTEKTPRLSELRLATAFALGMGLLSGCGTAGGDSQAALVSGLPKCDPSLLHPRITVGSAAGVPGKLIVYVDGVMACVDDASGVDQILSQVDGYAASPARPTP